MENARLNPKSLRRTGTPFPRSSSSSSKLGSHLDRYGTYEDINDHNVNTMAPFEMMTIMEESIKHLESEAHHGELEAQPRPKRTHTWADAKKKIMLQQQQQTQKQIGGGIEAHADDAPTAAPNPRRTTIGGGARVSKDRTSQIKKIGGVRKSIESSSRSSRTSVEWSDARSRESSGSRTSDVPQLPIGGAGSNYRNSVTRSRRASEAFEWEDTISRASTTTTPSIRRAGTTDTIDLNDIPEEELIAAIRSIRVEKNEHAHELTKPVPQKTSLTSLTSIKKKIKQIKEVAAGSKGEEESHKISGMVMRIRSSGFIVASQYVITQDAGGPPIMIITSVDSVLFVRRPKMERIILTAFTIEEPRTLIEEEQATLNKTPNSVTTATIGFDLFIAIKNTRKRFIMVPKDGIHMDTWNFLWPYRDHSRLGESYGSTLPPQPKTSLSSSSSPDLSRKSLLGHRSSGQAVLQTDFFVPLEFTCMTGIPVEWNREWWQNLCAELNIERRRFKVHQVTATSVLFGISPVTDKLEISARKLCDKLRKLKMTSMDIKKAVSYKTDSQLTMGNGDDGPYSTLNLSPQDFKGSGYQSIGLGTYTDAFLSFRATPGKLEIRVIKAIDLPVADYAFFKNSVKSSDPYCIIIAPTGHNRKETRRTRVVSKCLNPVWDEVFVFDCAYDNFHPSFILFTIYDLDVDADDLLGHGRMSIPFQEPGEVKSYKISIRSSDAEDSKPAGFLFVEALWMPTPIEEDETEAITPRKISIDPFIPPVKKVVNKYETSWTEKDQLQVDLEKAKMIFQRTNPMVMQASKQPAEVIAFNLVLFGCLLCMITLPTMLSIPLALVFMFVVRSASQKLKEPIKRGLTLLKYDIAKPRVELCDLFPHWEEATWLNSLIYHLWPYILVYVKKQIGHIPYVDLDIGPNPPLINGISAHFSGTKLNIDVDFQYISSITVSFRKRALFNDLRIMSTFRIEVGEWIPVPPMIRSAKVAMLSKPKICGGHILLIPVWIAVVNIAWFLCALPNKINLSELLVVDDNARLHLIGRLTIQLVDSSALATMLNANSLRPQTTFVRIEIQDEDWLTSVTKLQNTVLDIPAIQPREVVVSLLNGREVIGKAQRISLSATTARGIPLTRTIYFDKNGSADKLSKVRVSSFFRDAFSGRSKLARSSTSENQQDVLPVTFRFCWFSSIHTEEKTMEAEEQDLLTNGGLHTFEEIRPKKQRFRLRVWVQECRNLKPMKSLVECNPYAWLHVRDDGKGDGEEKVTYSTKIIKGVLNPQWYETFDFTISNPLFAVLSIVILNDTYSGQDAILGSAMIPVKDFLLKRHHESISLDESEAREARLILDGELSSVN